MDRQTPSARFVLSLDLELHWGVADHSRVEDYRANLAGVPRAVGAMLDRFRSRRIHCTWATVGMLFFDNRRQLMEGLPNRRPEYNDRRLSNYRLVGRLGRDEARDPYHYGRRLVEQIHETKGQEIGSHTFSHYYCLEPGQRAEDFRADLEAAQRAAQEMGITLRSIVFPRNQVNMAYLDVLRQTGFDVLRGAALDWYHRPRSGEEESLFLRANRLADAYLPMRRDLPQERLLADGLVDVPASRFLRPAGALSSLHLARIHQEIDEAAKQGALYHLWWHPHNFGANLEANLQQLDRILDRVDFWRSQGKMRSLTMAEAADEALERFGRRLLAA